MSMTVFPFQGDSGFSGTWTAITAARGFDKVLLDPPADTYWVRYTTGATAALQIGEQLTGGTSSAKARLIAQAVESGTAGSSDTGVLFIRIESGTPAAAGETWTGGTSTGTVATAQAPMQLKVSGPPKAAVLTVEGFSINFTMDGTTPTVTAGTNYGHTMIAGGSYQINGWMNVKQFQCINSVASSGSIVKYHLFF